ncbi:MAG TPA: hypothetical protein VGX03_36055 [Candidatus Binatia bacterium]|jgi:hypothetical protein|nr:hypothetical protein [Candidatus Binatia bacterium]
MRPRRHGLLIVALLIATLAPAWDGSGASEKSESGRVLVTFEQGFLTVFAQEVEIQQVFQAIATQSGIEVIPVNPPSGSTNVTVAIEQQPPEEAIRSVLQAIPSSAPLSYLLLYSQDHIRAVKIFFPAVGEEPAPNGHTSQESLPPLAWEPWMATAEPPTEEERKELIKELQAAGVPGEQVDEMRLLAVKHLKDQGMPLPEILESLGY